MQDSRKRVTAAQVADAAGVSRATVGFVLNDTPGQTISEATRDRVFEAAKELGYRPHRVARSLASGSTRIVLLVLPDWPLDHALRTHLEEASHALDEAGYSLVTWTPWPEGRARPLWEVLQPDVVLGLWPFSPEQAKPIAATGATVVTTETIPPSAFAALDYSKGPALQVEHLEGLGHRSIVFARDPDPRLDEIVAMRSELALETAAASGIDCRIIDFGAAAAPDDVTRLVDAGVTAVVAYNDVVAARVIGAASRAGIRVPGQLSVIGHDDDPLCTLTVPSITTIRVDTAGLGRFLARLALHAAGVGDPPEAGPETRAALVERESTGSRPH